VNHVLTLQYHEGSHARVRWSCFRSLQAWRIGESISWRKHWPGPSSGEFYRTLFRMTSLMIRLSMVGINFSFGLTVNVYAQSEPTFNVLMRITEIQSQFGKASMFSLDVDQREYWITAKHVITGKEQPPWGYTTASSVSLQALDPWTQPERWVTINFQVIDPGKDIDIVVLAPPEPVLPNPPPSVAADTAGVVLGGECEFLGYPLRTNLPVNFGSGTKWFMPLVKHCFVSSAPTSEPRMWVLDGINNPGFSGGPVVFRTGAAQKIMAVVSGYWQEPAEVVPEPAEGAERPPQAVPLEHPKEMVLVNTGFVLAFDIKYAIEAIHQHPIGPLRKPH
jgi:hypothetical protein